MHTGDTTETGKTPCKLCRYNWVEHEEMFTREELLVGLNKWGNPAHDGQEAVSTRKKTWDELYNEVDERLDEHVSFGDVPRQAPPRLRAEVEPEFELKIVGGPYMEGDMAKQRYAVLYYGEAKMKFIAEGKTKADFLADMNKKYSESQATILKVAKEADQAKVIVG